jgi:predicted metal-dependent phosphoesterase TrpH
MAQTIVKKVISRDKREGFLLDMHIHTNYSMDSTFTLEETLIELDGVVDALTITDHNTMGNFPKDILKGLESKYQMRIFTSCVEISTAQGDILAYGISAVPSLNLRPDEIIEVIHSENGLAVAAHPFTLLGLGDLIYDLDLDAIEINGLRSKQANEYAREAAESMGLPMIGGSDSHNRFHVGTCVTEFPKKVESIAEIVELVKKGDCKPVYLQY